MCKNRKATNYEKKKKRREKRKKRKEKSFEYKNLFLLQPPLSLLYKMTKSQI